MAWRTVSHGKEVWHVDVAAERRPNHRSWQLMLSFRKPSGDRARSFWAAYPIEAMSKSSLFIQAEQISDDALQAVLLENVV